MIEKKHHKSILIKFFLVLLVFAGYLFFVVERYGTTEGLWVTFLTWSFFVLCTPIADAGFLIDFPLRLITGWKMFRTELMVWLIAGVINFSALMFNPGAYEKTHLLKLFKHILLQPFPLWIIIVISAVGTFISVKVGDEVLDKKAQHKRIFYKQHQNKWYWLMMIFLFIIILVIYDFLAKKTGLFLIEQ